MNGSDHPDTLLAGTAGEAVQLRGNGGGDLLRGGPGDDLLWGFAGDDRLEGEGGDDELVGWDGADVFRGGPGLDEANYRSALGPQTITFDDRPGDGATGEGDDVGADVETIFLQTVGPNVAIGSAEAQRLFGGPGDDRFDGGAGPDQLIGEAGHNELIGGPGPDELITRSPTDQVLAADGERDTVDCRGPGEPRIAADPFDRLIACAPELVIRRPKAIALRRGRTAALRVSCPRGVADCAGRVRLMECRYRGAVLGRGRYRIAAGRSATIAIRLGQRGRRLARRGKRLCATAYVLAQRIARPASNEETWTNLVLVRTGVQGPTSRAAGHRSEGLLSH